MEKVSRLFKFFLFLLTLFSQEIFLFFSLRQRAKSEQDMEQLNEKMNSLPGEINDFTEMKHKESQQHTTSECNSIRSAQKEDFDALRSAQKEQYDLLCKLAPLAELDPKMLLGAFDNFASSSSPSIVQAESSVVTETSGPDINYREGQKYAIEQRRRSIICSRTANDKYPTQLQIPSTREIDIRPGKDCTNIAPEHTPVKRMDAEDKHVRNMINGSVTKRQARANGGRVVNSKMNLTHISSKLSPTSKRPHTSGPRRSSRKKSGLA